MRGVRRRFATGPRRIVLPGDPLPRRTRPPFAPGAIRTSNRSWRPARTLRSPVGRASPIRMGPPTPAPTCSSATTACTRVRRRRSRSCRAADRDQLLGSISLMRFSWPHARAEVGYWLAREARGHGHATRAVRLITAWGFRSLALQRIDLMAATGIRRPSGWPSGAGSRARRCCARTSRPRTSARTWWRSGCWRARRSPLGKKLRNSRSFFPRPAGRSQRLGSLVRWRSNHSRTDTVG